MLQDVKPEHTFWLKGGKGIKNLAELNREVKRMNEETFKHHVNETKNDFAAWTEQCIPDKKLAYLLKTTKSRERTAAIIERRIQELTQIKPPQKKPKEQKYKTTIIRTKNTTPIEPKEVSEIVQPEREIIRTPHKTTLHLGTNKTEIYVHEVKQAHHSFATLTSYLSLGIIAGIAITLLLLS